MLQLFGASALIAILSLIVVVISEYASNRRNTLTISVAIVSIFSTALIGIVERQEVQKNQVAAQVEQAEARREAQVMREQLEQSKAREIDLAEQLTIAREQIARLEENVGAGVAETRGVRAELGAARSELDRARVEQAEARREAQVMREQLEQSKAREIDLAEQLTIAREQIARLEENVDAGVAETRGVRAELGAARSELDRARVERELARLNQRRNEYCATIPHGLLTGNEDIELLAGGGCACGRYFSIEERRRRRGAMVPCENGSQQGIWPY